MGADDTRLEDNTVKHNVTAGIAIVRLAAENSDKDPELEPFSDRTRIGWNALVANGLDPHPEIAEAYGRGADLMWETDAELRYTAL